MTESEVLVRQGEAGTDISLFLDGVVDVYVDDDLVAEVGPGAVVGEQDLIEGGVRSSTVLARTDADVASVPGGSLNQQHFADPADLHRRQGRSE